MGILQNNHLLLGVGALYDSDALAFINAADITNITQKKALDRLVKRLKVTSLWGKCKAIYPFVGGNSTAHRFNLKDPRDLDIAGRITFYDSPTHDGLGVGFNGGGTQYGDTHIIPSNIYSVVNDMHVSFYSQTNNYCEGAEIGSNTGADTNGIVMSIKLGGDPSYGGRYAINNNANVATGGNVFFRNVSSAKAFVIMSRDPSSTDRSYTFYDGVGKEETVAFYDTQGLSTNPVTIGAVVSQGLYSTQTCSFASIGDGFAPYDCLEFDLAVTEFQTALSRAIRTISGTKVKFYGDSLTAGVGASTPANRWTSLLCATKGWTELNFARSGSRLDQVIDHISPKEVGDKYIWISFGINDRAQGVTDEQFQDTLNLAIDECVRKRYEPNEIIINCCYYCSGIFTVPPSGYLDLAIAAQAVATDRGTQFVNPFYVYDNDDLLDGVHPGDPGHAALADFYDGLIPD